MSEIHALGEVIASDSRLLEAECHQLYCAPPFGSFVRADCVGSGLAQFAVITHVSTGPFDGNRVVQAHRMPPGELEQRKPHLTSLLRTTFQARVVGYGNADGQVVGTPALPARLHCYLYPATAEEIRGVTGTPNFLRPLVDTPDVPLEDLLVSAIHAAQGAWGHDAPMLAWGKYLARLLQRDYVTLEGVLHRLAPTTAPAPRPTQPAAVPVPPGAAAPPAGGAPRPRGTNGRLAAPLYEEPLPIAGYDPKTDPFV